MRTQELSMAILSYCLWYCNCSWRGTCFTLSLSPFKRKTDIFIHVYTVRRVHVLSADNIFHYRVSCHLLTALISLRSTRSLSFSMWSPFLSPMTIPIRTFVTKMHIIMLKCFEWKHPLHCISTLFWIRWAEFQWKRKTSLHVRSDSEWRDSAAALMRASCYANVYVGSNLQISAWVTFT